MRIPSRWSRLVLFALFALVAAGTALAAIGTTRNPNMVRLPPNVAYRPYEPQKVVYHLTEGGGWFGRWHARRLATIESHYRAAGDAGLDLVVVMNGDGLDLLVAANSDEALARRIDLLRLKGARFLVSAETLSARNLDPERDLHGVAAEDIVPAGVAELARLQSHGYAYIRP